MEIVNVISQTPAPGKGEELSQHMIGLAKYFNDNYSKYCHIDIMTSMDGPGRVHWVGRCKSYAAFEEAVKAWESDPKRKDFGEAGRGLVSASETHFYRMLT
jgi:hypothetical protein